MNSLRLLPVLAIAAALAACGEPPTTKVPPEPVAPAAPPAAPAAKPQVSLDGEGLRLVSETGSTSLLAFAVPEAQAITALTAALGPPGERVTNPDCGAGPIDFLEWSNDLQALFQDGKFVGWSLGRDGAKGPTTMNGIGVGSTRTALNEAFSDTKVEETTLGQEFTAGGLSGILSSGAPDATVETVWAGMSCVFR